MSSIHFRGSSLRSAGSGAPDASGGGGGGSVGASVVRGSVRRPPQRDHMSLLGSFLSDPGGLDDEYGDDYGGGGGGGGGANDSADVVGSEQGPQPSPPCTARRKRLRPSTQWYSAKPSSRGSSPPRAHSRVHSQAQSQVRSQDSGRHEAFPTDMAEACDLLRIPPAVSGLCACQAQCR